MLIAQESDTDAESDQANHCRILVFSFGGRERMLERQELGWSHSRPKYRVGLIVTQTFKMPYAGLADLVSASVHLNNVQAKTGLVAVQIGPEFWAAAQQRQVDIVGWISTRALSSFEFP